MRYSSLSKLWNAGDPKLVHMKYFFTRKLMFVKESDAICLLPGGFGTLEECFEVVTWSMLGIHTKPVGLLNVAGYYDLLLQFLERVQQDQFLRPEHRALLTVSDEPEALLEAVEKFEPKHVEKWMRPSEK